MIKGDQRKTPSVFEAELEENEESMTLDALDDCDLAKICGGSESASM